MSCSCRQTVPLLLLLAATASEAATCSVSTPAAGMEFGTYSPTSLVDKDETMAVTVTCTAGLLELLVNYNVRISAGLGSAGNSDPFNPRQMQHAAQPSIEMNYNLYLDALYTRIWKDVDTDAGGNTLNGSLSYVVPGTQSNVHVVYGRVPAGQAMPAGEYNDTVQITVVF